MHLGKASRITHDLGCLTTSGVSEWTEVRHVVDAWLPWPSTLVAAHMPSTCQSFDPHIEGVRGRDISEGLSGNGLGEACGITDHLGELSPGDLVIGTERTIGIPGYDPSTG